ncbi:MAG: septum formation initiator family protein [Desulfohalobiaceae bacterium]|nr:septum formation initiator family protein [Desulfohalobiaceae bacterium]
MMLRRFLILILVGINALLLYQIFAPGKALQQYRDSRKAYSELRRNLKEVERENVRLSRRIRLLQNSTVYQGKVVRSKTGFVGQGEILYLPFEP